MPPQALPGKLGKKAQRIDRRTLKLARYLTAPLAPPPPSVDWTGPVVSPWGMMLNDKLGDCTCAAAGHMEMCWTANRTPPGIVPPNPSILAAYEAVGGYNPAVPASDQGAVELDVLNYWRNTGISGMQIMAYAFANPANHMEIQQAINLFGGIYIGVQLPISAQAQTGSLWDVAPDPAGAVGSWGGHAIPILAYDQNGLTCVTWGALQKMTWAFWDKYVDESYAILSASWTGGNAVALATLQADLALIA